MVFTYIYCSEETWILYCSKACWLLSEALHRVEWYTERSGTLSGAEVPKCCSVFFVKQIKFVLLNSADWRFSKKHFPSSIKLLTLGFTATALSTLMLEIEQFQLLWKNIVNKNIHPWGIAYHYIIYIKITLMSEKDAYRNSI